MTMTIIMLLLMLMMMMMMMMMMMRYFLHFALQYPALLSYQLACLLNFP